MQNRLTKNCLFTTGNQSKFKMTCPIRLSTIVRDFSFNFRKYITLFGDWFTGLKFSSDVDIIVNFKEYLKSFINKRIIFQNGRYLQTTKL